MLYAYPIWLVGFLVFPLAVLWAIKFRDLVKYRRIFLKVILGALIYFVPWDVFAVQNRFWFFEGSHTSGLRALGLPLEEYLYIICMTLWLTSITALWLERHRDEA